MDEAAAALERDGGHSLAAAALRLHAERVRTRRREVRVLTRFLEAHPDIALTEVPALPLDVHDLAGLHHLGRRVASGQFDDLPAVVALPVVGEADLDRAWS